MLERDETQQPQNPTTNENENLREKAMQNMRRIYSQANKVIVLDSDLLRMRGHNLSAEELLARIISCSWIRRLWTLQEAALARKLWYQGTDDAFTINPETEPITEALFDDEVAYYCRSLEYDNWRNLARAWNQEPPTDNSDGKAHTVSSVLQVTKVWSAFKSRQGSHGADEPGCYATLLDMPLDKVYIGPEATRLKRLWRLYRVLPAGVLFAPAPKLHDEPGYEWAFSDLSYCAEVMAPSTHPLHVTVRGLCTHLPGIMLAERLPSNRQSVIAVSISDTIFYITQNTKRNNLPWHPGQDFSSSPGDLDHRSKSNSPAKPKALQLHNHHKLAVILGTFTADKTTQSQLENLQGCLGALVTLTADSPGANSEPGVMACLFLRTVSVIRKDSAFDKRTDWTVNTNSTEEKTLVVSGSFTAAGTGWRIGDGQPLNNKS